GPLSITLEGAWRLELGVSASGGRLWFPHGGPPRVLDGPSTLALKPALHREGTPTTLGPDSGAHLLLPVVDAAATVDVDASGLPRWSASLGLPGAGLALGDSPIGSLLAAALNITIDLALSAGRGGLTLGGGGVQATVPAS